MVKKKTSRARATAPKKKSAVKRSSRPSAKLTRGRKTVRRKKLAAARKQASRRKPAAAKRTAAKRMAAKRTAVRKGAAATRAATRKKPAGKKPVQKRRKRSSEQPEAVFTVNAPMAARGLGAEAGGQSGDTEGLSRAEVADSESVEELVEEGQAFEAGIVGGVENAPDADQGGVRTRQVP